MKKVKQRIPAKINLTLDVSNLTDGYHPIRSIVCSVDIYDTVILKKRKDCLITLKEKGIKSGCPIEENNAVKAVAKYMESFGVCGANIVLKKGIPVGAGLGGSSADVAGTLILMEKLYGKNANVKEIADTLGSDTGYMTIGGLKVISGRGEVVEDINASLDAFLIVLTDSEPISTKECYANFDKLGSKPTCTEKALKALESGEKETFARLIKNDLYAPAVNFLPRLKTKINDLKKAGATTALMTGSGSAVYGLFLNQKQRDFAYKILRKKYKNSIIKAKTLG